MKPEYHACGTTTARNSGGQEDENELKYQKAVDVRKLTPSTPSAPNVDATVLLVL